MTTDFIPEVKTALSETSYLFLDFCREHSEGFPHIFTPTSSENKFNSNN